ncbi:MAG: hypothetical protein PHR35_22150 [Kiritimatiellae bacterium]|nr:hypothetical protein [Kiritimatiellia bacterium]
MTNETMASGQKDMPGSVDCQSGPSEPDIAAERGRNNIRTVIVCTLLALVILGFDLLIPLGVADSIPYIAVVLLSLRHEQRRFTVMMAVFCSVLTILGFFFSPPSGEMWKVLTNRALALFAIWVTAVLTLQRKALEEKRDQAIREREEAMAQVKILQGFLPICASCKKIRDDQGAWSQMEVYIRDHSEAEFSHGICPDCARKLYPEFYPGPEPDGHSS